jgi:uncharacterized protein
VKFLFWLIIGCIVVAWLLHDKKSLKAPDTATAEKVRAKSSAGAETMIQCAHCGLHVPVSESVTNSAGVVFCSEEHRRLGVRS